MTQHEIIVLGESLGGFGEVADFLKLVHVRRAVEWTRISRSARYLPLPTLSRQISMLTTGL